MCITRQDCKKKNVSAHACVRIWDSTEVYSRSSWMKKMHRPTWPLELVGIYIYIYIERERERTQYIDIYGQVFFLRVQMVGNWCAHNAPETVPKSFRIGTKDDPRRIPEDDPRGPWWHLMTPEGLHPGAPEGSCIKLRAGGHQRVWCYYRFPPCLAATRKRKMNSIFVRATFE